jgi:hypothetical protein
LPGKKKRHKKQQLPYIRNCQQFQPGAILIIPTMTELISQARIRRIKCQGYDKNFSDEEISQHSIGNRFAYQLCTLLFASGLALTSIPILIIAAGIAALAVFLPYHPFDYLYNSIIRHLFHRPKLPRRPAQTKFACGIASIWLGIIIYLFHLKLFLWGYILGGMLLTVALLVSIIDYCIPSIIYNSLFKKTK